MQEQLCGGAATPPQGWQDKGECKPMTPLTRILARFGICSAVGLAVCLLLRLQGWYLLPGAAAIGLCLYGGKAMFLFAGKMLASAGNTAFMCLLFRSYIGLFVVLALLIPALVVVTVVGMAFGAVLLVRDIWQACHGNTGGRVETMDLWNS